MEEQNQVDALQRTVDKAKTISLLSNLHNLTPPQKTDENPAGQVAIIEALKSSPRLQQVFLEIMGMIYDDKTRRAIQIAKPIMNINGAFRLIFNLRRIAEETEFSYYHEDEIPSRIYMHYQNIYPYFTFWHDDYDLDPADFECVSTAIITFIDSSFHKAKGGKLLNVPGRVYSEDFMGKVLSPQEKQQQKQSALSLLNPFKKR